MARCRSLKDGDGQEHSQRRPVGAAQESNGGWRVPAVYNTRKASQMIAAAGPARNRRIAGTLEEGGLVDPLDSLHASG
jgi:hypothetical protein